MIQYEYITKKYICIQISIEFTITYELYIYKTAGIRQFL